MADEQVQALAKAARLFQDEQTPWPPILEQVLHELTRSVTEDEAVPPATQEADEVDMTAEEGPSKDEKGVKRFLSALKRKKD
ncbi:hypothetical protein [Methylobacterium brachythecii]|uniref:Uncharacterized protein n=1 Tax=Methylobacterium brachythecii TaxID=1176177 RepID=A0A7W6F8T3_9HYPH|nr:hypothetical protein [Methylobacterium brachythecii]MBB3904745.1 hypothetical protein [Methylobacterium brachythecii]GLS45580.1 hypothetical protein GCM10007884_35710 [Methylobacterium brachythecii]